MGKYCKDCGKVMENKNKNYDVCYKCFNTYSIKHKPEKKQTKTTQKKQVKSQVNKEIKILQVTYSTLGLVFIIGFVFGILLF